MAKHPLVKQPLTKKAFMQLLARAAQPLPEKQHAPKATGTSAVHPSDDCSETDKSQDKIEDAED